MIRGFWIGALLFSISAKAAPCLKPVFNSPEEVKLTGRSVLIATHPSRAFDGRMASKVGMDAAVKAAKARKIPVIYLQDDGDERDYFFEDCEPDYRLFSRDGDIRVDLRPSQVITVGGHWELCQSRTLHDVMYLWSRQPARDLRITVYMDGTYMKGSLSFEESDPYYGDFTRFMGIVNYDRPGSEVFNNKLTLLEAMGIISREFRQLDFLARILPHYARTLPGHRVELRLNGSVPRILQKGKGPKPPVLTFEFLSSAMEFGP
ncbi:MAG: hypothetical protein NDJ89_11710 [Oligoflexia bacterium]|nr:hypothetical protein [Oligoflexia bacterium]